MKEAKKFIPKVKDLLIAQKAKRVIEGFLDAECSPNIALSPSKAERLRRGIIKHVWIVSEHLVLSGKYEKAVTWALASELEEVATANRAQGRKGVAARLEILAELLRSVITKSKSKKSGYVGRSPTKKA